MLHLTALIFYRGYFFQPCLARHIIRSSFVSSFVKTLLIIILLPIVGALLFAVLWNPNWFKNDIDEQLQHVPHIGIQFEQIDHSLLRPGKLGINDIVLDGDLVKGSIASLQLEVAVSPAFEKRVVIERVTLVNPVLHVNMTAVNHLAQENSNQETEHAAKDSTEDTQPDSPLPLVSAVLKHFAIENGLIKDVSEQQLFSLSGLDITLESVHLVQQHRLITAANLPPVALQISIKDTFFKQQPLGAINLEANGNAKQMRLEQLSMKTPQSQLVLNGSIDSPLDSPTVSVNIQPSVVTLDDFSGFYGDLPITPAGTIDISGELQPLMVQDDVTSMLQNLNGSLSLGLEQGLLRGIDINQIVAAIKESRETDMKDIGTFLVSGPIGMLASQFVDLGWGSGSVNSEYQTAVPQLRFNSAIENGVLNLQDTAFATDQYRMAFDGGIDAGNASFSDFTFSILDSAGCADIQQTLNGPMDDPSSAVTDTLVETLISPLKGLLKNVANQIKKCQPVYQGDVAHPTKN